MEIKFLQDYKGYKKNEIVKKSKLIAKKLIDGSIAEFVEKSFVIKKLYVATLIKPEMRNIVHMEGEAKYVGIFTKEENGYALIKPVFTHLRTKRKFITNNRLKHSDNDLKNNGLVVDDRTVEEFSLKFFDDMIKNGWTINSSVSINDIIKMEERINGKPSIKTDEGNIR